MRNRRAAVEEARAANRNDGARVNRSGERRSRERHRQCRVSNAIERVQVLAVGWNRERARGIAVKRVIE